MGNKLVWSKDRRVLTIYGPRPVKFGLAKDSADLIGHRSVLVTPDMVGETIAIFVSAEVKKPGKKLTPGQENWMREVRRAGGLADVVHSPDDLKKFDTGSCL